MSLEIWNNLDEVALFFNLERFPFETNDAFYGRIRRFTYWRYGSDYYTQSHSIPLQLGLDYYEVAKLYSPMNIPFKVTIDWNYFIFEELNPNKTKEEQIYKRMFINKYDLILENLLEFFYDREDFKVEIHQSNKLSTSQNFIIRNQNYKIIRDEIELGKKVKLKYGNIIKESFKSDSSYFEREVDGVSELERQGDFFIDYDIGYIEFYNENKNSIIVFYETLSPRFTFETTDCNLVPFNIISQFGLTDEIIDYIPSILNNKTWGK